MLIDFKIQTRNLHLLFVRLLPFTIDRVPLSVFEFLSDNFLAFSSEKYSEGFSSLRIVDLKSFRMAEKLDAVLVMVTGMTADITLDFI